jgi:hypothetical protein
MNPLQTHGAVSRREHLAADIPSTLKFYIKLPSWIAADLPAAENEEYTFPMN